MILWQPQRILTRHQDGLKSRWIFAPGPAVTVCGLSWGLPAVGRRWEISEYDCRHEAQRWWGLRPRQTTEHKTMVGRQQRVKLVELSTLFCFSLLVAKVNAPWNRSKYVGAQQKLQQPCRIALKSSGNCSESLQSGSANYREVINKDRPFQHSNTQFWLLNINFFFCSLSFLDNLVWLICCRARLLTSPSTNMLVRLP